MTLPSAEPDLSRGNLLQGGALLMANAILQALAGLAVQLVLMNLLLPEDFGRYALVAAGIGVIQMLLSLRAQSLIVRTRSENLTAARHGRYVTALLAETVAVALIAGVWLWATETLDCYTATLLLSLLAGQVIAAGTALVERTMKYRRIALAEAASMMTGYSVAIVVALAGAPLSALYGRELLQIGIRTVLLARLGALHFARPVWLDLAAWIAVAREGRDFWAEGLMEGGFNRLLAVGVAAGAGPAGLGLFTQSQRLAGLPHLVLQPVVSRLAAPLFARLEDRPSRFRAFWRLCMGLLGILIPASAIAVVLAEPVIPRLLGPHWAPAVPVFSAMVGMILFTSLFEAGRSYCMMRKLTGTIMAARAAQYAVMAAGFLLSLDREEPAILLAGSLSCAMGLSFAILFAGIWRTDGRG